MACHLLQTLVLGLLTNNVLSYISNYNDTNYRLNSLFKPFCYYITITPHFQSTHGENAQTFDGKVSVIISPNVNTNQIQIHSKNLTFTANNITVSDSQTVNPVTTLEFNAKYDFVYINVQNEMQAGVEYTLEILYTGVIRKDRTGFYMDQYYTNVNEKLIWKRLGATHLEPISARTVFPCFDEPAYKAVFTLIIDRPDGFKPSVANMKLFMAVPLEHNLLYDPEQSIPSSKLLVSQFLAHETAHMWFGNLVTCHWWSDVWLNEGFANYFQDYITAIIEPEIGAEDSMVTDSLYEGYNVDESPSSPAINNNANSPDEIEAKFGKISYHKAGSVIRMIHHLLGAKAFQLGLKDYLKQNQFKVGYPDKLYTSFHQAAINTSALADYPGTNIAGIMGPWITQPGHPILTVNIDYENESVLLTQKRFYLNSSYDSNETYPIPVTYTTELAPDFNNTKPAFIMNERSRVLNLTGLSTEPWLIFNVQETGFYRVNYDERAWKKIANVLKGNQREVLHHLNRAKIVNDLFAFANAGVVKFELLYEVLEFLSEETNFSVWNAAIRGLNNLRKSKLGTPGQKEVEARAITLMEGIITKLGYEVRNTDDFDTLRNRMQVLVFACKLGHQGCIDNAIALFKNFRGNGTEISPSLRPVVYCYGLRHGTVEDDDFLIQRRWFTTNLASEALMIRTALNCPDDKKRLQKFYEFAEKKLQKKQHLNG
ncbi:membrane alanyl aminopeptidase-like isoform X2 [Choristoneura fumiferana]|uniref:membrane alanyl aminopeptidase-like isoform X2 n=1 Tax=Choristoneura fumiferana TaxID=7141 RepID=UPI003D1536ED